MAIKNTSEKLSLKVIGNIFKLLLNLGFYALVAFLIINVSKLTYDFTYQFFGPVTVQETPGTNMTVEIQKGDSSMDIASKLENERAIENKYVFYLKTKLQEAVIMPGTYKINNSMTYDDILNIITDISNSTTKEKNVKSDKGKGTTSTPKSTNQTK